MEPIRHDCEMTADATAPGERPAVSPPQRDRRMHLRAYNHWASMLDRRRFPTVADLANGTLGDIAAHSVLLDFSAGPDNAPAIAYLGERLARECGAGEAALRHLADAPQGSLLARLAGHYQAVLANRAPTGFEAEFTGPLGATVLYRGILLPFSSDDAVIDYALAVINWKETAADEKSPQPREPAGRSSAARRTPAPAAMLTDWADGPGSALDHAAEPAPDTIMEEHPLPGARATEQGPVDDLLAPSPADTPCALPASVVESLRHLPLRPLATLPSIGAEFALAIVRRPASGPAALLGEVPHDPVLLAEAARRLAL